jgi:hypothetical protein
MTKAGRRWDPTKIGRRVSVPLGHDAETDDADPANGARVPRCGACGMPDPADLIGERAGLRGRFPLCQACWFRVNPPDPLHVPEAA